MSEHYCIHGQYIGDPYGPDYICGLCEDGATKPAFVNTYTLYFGRTGRLSKFYDERNAVESLNYWVDRYPLEDRNDRQRFTIVTRRELVWEEWEDGENVIDYLFDFAIDNHLDPQHPVRQYIGRRYS